jgi:superfamily II DNA or RNA helicase
MNNMYLHERKQLRKIGDNSLRELIGENIVSAVSKTYETNFLKDLSEIILLKFGNNLFKQKELVKSLIDSQDLATVIEFCKFRNLNYTSDLGAYKCVRDFFTKAISQKKSELLCDFLGFSTDFAFETIIDSRESMETIRTGYGETIKLKGNLHSYQKRVKDQILSKLVTPDSRVMVQMPTGAGKTVTGLETAVDILRAPFQKKYFVWLVNSNELAEQALESFKFLWKVKGDRPLTLFRFFNKFSPNFIDESEGGAVFASYDLFYSILHKQNDARKPSLVHLINNTEYLIVDEAHGAVAETHEHCINAFIRTDNTKIVGLSATPIRNDYDETMQLLKLFSSNLVGLVDESSQQIESPIEYLQKNSYLARIDTHILDTGIVCDEENENKILQSLAKDSNRNEQILKQIILACEEGDKTLVFACTKDHVIALYILCRAEGLPVSFITGDVPQSRRIQILEEFNSGDLMVLLNLDILQTGVDLPNVNRLILARPVRSPIAYSQIIGRALRGPKNGGNEKNTIVNLQDNINYFSDLPLLYSSFKNTWGTETL